MTAPEVRLSPDGRNVAIRNRAGKVWQWRGTFGREYALYADADVATWTPLLPVSNQDGAELEQLPPVLDRAADELHRGH